MLLCVCVVLLLLLFSRLRWIHTLSIIHYSVNIEKSLPLTVFDLVVFTPDWQFCVQQCIPVFHAWFGGLNCVEGIWMSDSSWARGRARTHSHTHTHTRHLVRYLGHSQVRLQFDSKGSHAGGERAATDLMQNHRVTRVASPERQNYKRHQPTQIYIDLDLIWLKWSKLEPPPPLKKSFKLWIKFLLAFTVQVLFLTLVTY